MTVYVCGHRTVPGRMELHRSKPKAWIIRERDLPHRRRPYRRRTPSGTVTGADPTLSAQAAEILGTARPKPDRLPTPTITLDEYRAKPWPITRWCDKQWRKPLRAARYGTGRVADLVDDFHHDGEGNYTALDADEPIIRSFSNPDQLEVCRFCHDPIPLPKGECEFGGQEGCECSGCARVRSRGRQPYQCGKPECRRKADNARQRRKYRRDRGIKLQSCNQGHTRVASV